MDIPEVQGEDGRRKEATCMERVVPGVCAGSHEKGENLGEEGEEGGKEDEEIPSQGPDSGNKMVEGEEGSATEGATEEQARSDGISSFVVVKKSQSAIPFSQLEQVSHRINHLDFGDEPQ